MAFSLNDLLDRGTQFLQQRNEQELAEKNIDLQIAQYQAEQRAGSGTPGFDENTNANTGAVRFGQFQATGIGVVAIAAVALIALRAAKVI